jgi:hypothetical protein
MSDPHAPGEPVEEPTEVDDVVVTANEGLADAEAARRDVASEPEAADAEVVDAAVAEPAGDDIPWYERDDVPLDDAPTAVAPTAMMEPAVTPSEPVFDAPTEVVAPVVVATPLVAPSPAPQPIFVQAPEPPRPRGNRAAAGAIGLLAALSFAVLYLVITVAIGLVDGSIASGDLAQKTLQALTTWALWIPVAVFFVAFWLLGAIVNRGRWGLWVVFGLLVGVASYGGHLLGQLFQAQFWTLTASQGEELVKGQLWVPLAFAAFIIGRELTIWFGAWIASRGKRITELNYEAQREYERTLEAGPPIIPTAQG